MPRNPTTESSKNLSEKARRKEAVELFIKAIEASPGLFLHSTQGKQAAEEIIEGSDLLMEYLQKGKKP